MAVVTGSFSIREYAARGRAELGFHKCWPFSCEGEDAPSLPPISVRRFRWWADVVVAARSEALHEMEACPYNTSSAPESEIVAGNEMVEVKTPSPLAKPMDDEDSKAAPGSPSRVEGRRPSKGKLRNPKKRSIVELFATAPQVAVAVSEDETDDGNGGCRGKEGKEVDAVVVEHKGDIELSTKTKKETKQSKMRRKRRKRKKGIPEGHKVELRDWVKEKMCPKISSVYSSMLQHPLCRRRIKSAKSPVRSQRKSNSMKAIRIKHREMQTSKLMSRNQVVGKKLHIRRAYKNQEKHIAARRSRKIISARAAKLAKLYCKSNRHVTFSTKDDILEHSKTCSSMNYPRLKSLCHVISDAFVASSVMNHSSTIADGPDAIDRPQMVNSGENGSPAGVLDRIEAFSYESIQLNDSHAKANQPPTVNSSIRNCSGPEKASFAVMFDLNHAVETSGDLDDLSPTTNFSPSFICSDNHSCRGTIHSKDLNSAALIHLEASLPIASDTSLVPTRHDKFVSVSDSKSSPTLINNPSSASRLIASNLSNVRQYHTHVHAMMNNCHQIEENQSAHLCPSMGLLSSVCYSMGSKGLAESGLTQELGSLCKSKCSEDFIGLPLNSQGELIQLSSGTKFSEICRRQNTELCSSYGLSANKQVESNCRMSHLEMKKKKVVGPASYLKDQTGWFQKPYYSTRERVRHWLNFTEFTGPQVLEVQNNGHIRGKDRFLHSNSNPANVSLHGSRNGNSKRELFSGIDLEGKCTSDYQRPAVQSIMRLMGTNVIVDGIDKECHSLDDRRWCNRQNVDEKSDFAIIPERKFSNQWMTTECATLARANVNQLQLSDSAPKFGHRDALEPKLDSIQIAQPHWLSRTNLSSATVNPHSKLNADRSALPPQTLLIKANQFLGNCISGEGSMGHHYPAAVSSQQNVNQHMLLSSTPCGPKQRVPCGQPPLIKRPAKLPPWLLHAEQQKQNQISDSLYCDQTPFSPACNMSGTNLNSHLSAYQAPMIPFSFPQCHCHRACSSFTPNACSPSFIAQVPATKSNTEFKKSINSRKNERGGIYSKFNGFTGSFDSLKLRKRQADIERVMNPAKKPCLAKQVDTDLRGGQNQMHKYALDKSTTLNFQRTENGKRECRITSGSSSSRFGKGLRSGPTKLIAGLKHILIPCQRIDDDYCRPIHTTRPFYSNAASGNFFGPEEKITNIYKF